MAINLHEPMIDVALQELKEDAGYKIPDNLLDKLFSERYNCKIIAENEWGINGHVEFPDDHSELLFRLKYSDAKR